MLALKQLLLFFIISRISLCTTEQEEQEKFTQQYHSIIRQSLSKVSSVFDSIEYDIKDGKFKMKWLHGNEPTLDFSFDVIFQEKSTCHLEFVIDSYLAHVPEKIRFDVNSAQVNEIIQQVQKCSEKIEQILSGPSDVSYDTQLIKQGTNLLNKEKSLSEDQRREIERVVLMNQSDIVQKQFVEHPKQTINKMKVINQYVDNEDISEEQKHQIKQQVLRQEKGSKSYSSNFHSLTSSEHTESDIGAFESYTSNEQSVESKKSTKDIEVGFTNDDNMPEYSEGRFGSSEQSVIESGFSEDINLPAQNKRTSTILDNVLDQLQHADFSEDSEEEQSVSSHSSKQNQNSGNSSRLSQESQSVQVSSEQQKVLNQNGQTQEQDNKCSVLDKNLIKEKMKFLILQNFIQDVKVFDENIVECKRVEGVRMNAVLSFNREKCFIGLDGTFANGYKMLKDLDKSSTGFLVEDNMMNCVDRFGTYLLKSS